MKKTIKFSIVFLLFLCQISFAQGPWTKEKGKTYAQIGFSGVFYDQAVLEGNLVSARLIPSDIVDVTTQLYAEYGITNNIEIQAIIPYKSVSYKTKFGNNSESLSGFGNITVGTKYKLSDKDWKISSGLLFSANSISKKPEVHLSTGFNASTLFPYLSIGSSAGKWYYFGNLGYGYMTNDFSDFIKIGAEVGYKFNSKGHLIALIDSKNTVIKEKAFENDPNQWASYSDRQSYTAVGLKANYEFSKDKFGANFAAIGALALNNAPAAPSFNLGIYTKF
jgi:Putative MetA-pathway of phenol degradation